MRQPHNPPPKRVDLITALIVGTVAVFILQQIINVTFPGFGGRDNYFMTNWFALSGKNFQELKVWTILSYSFLHSTVGFMHIIGNMLGLFFIGRIILPIIGRSNFLLLYFGGAIAGGLVYLVFHYADAQPVVGASAAVFAILTFFCLIRPEEPITLLLFFVLPITVKPKWVFWSVLGISAFGLLLYELPGASSSRMAHSAHLGGVFAGILFHRFVYNSKSSFIPSSTQTTVELPEWIKKKKPVEKKISYTVNISNRDDMHKEVDRILDKINETGFGSLTESEKSTLDRAKDILSK